MYRHPLQNLYGLASHFCAFSWVIDIVVEKKLPKFIKVTFFVLPHPLLGYKSFKRERLIANDFLQIRFELAVSGY